MADLREALEPFRQYCESVLTAYQATDPEGILLTDDAHGQRFAIRVKHLQVARAALSAPPVQEPPHHLFCDEAHEHHAPKCCAADCWCRVTPPGVESGSVRTRGKFPSHLPVEGLSSSGHECAAIATLKQAVEKYSCTRHKPLRFPLCAHCQMAARIEEVVDFLAQPCPSPRMSDDYVAWLRWTGDQEHRHLVVCNSDAEGAFKVYR